METLPIDITNTNLWTSLPYHDIISLCDVNLRFNRICQLDSTWKFLIERDFGIDYNGFDPYNTYLDYYEILNYFSKYYRIITQRALLFIWEYVSESYWPVIDEQTKIHREMGYNHPILSGDIVISLLDEGRVTEVIQFKEFFSDFEIKFMGKQIDQNGCNEYMLLVSKPTFVFIDTILTTIKYDIELTVLLQLYTHINCNDKENDVFKYLYNLIGYVPNKGAIGNR